MEKGYWLIVFIEYPPIIYHIINSDAGSTKKTYDNTPSPLESTLYTTIFADLLST
jgi:hypothetical protein